MPASPNPTTETKPDVAAKALRLNIDTGAYGAFAEIGGGQEVSRWFFRVGGAAGTVAKTMSAYDMAVSDAIYGKGTRYVSRERCRAMLDHEYGLLLERLDPARGGKSRFFAFADTVATRSYKGGNECHGWLGLRFQHEPHAKPSEIVVHAALLDQTAQLQQQTVGELGVNMIHAAYYQRESFEEMLAALMDGLTLENLEIDVVELSGPAFEGRTDPRSIAITMLARGLTPAVVFDEHGVMDQPSSVFRKRALLIHRESTRGVNPRLGAMLEGAKRQMASEGPLPEKGVLPLLELSIQSNAAQLGEARDATVGDLRPLVDRVFQPGCAAMLTRLGETYRLGEQIRRVTDEPMRFVVGLDAAVTVFHEQYYRNLSGGVLEALGRLLSSNVKMYAFPMEAGLLRERLAAHNVEPEFWSAPDKPVLSADDLTLAPPAGHLMNFLRSAGWIVAVEAD